MRINVVLQCWYRGRIFREKQNLTKKPHAVFENNNLNQYVKCYVGFSPMFRNVVSAL